MKSVRNLQNIINQINNTAHKFCDKYDKAAEILGIQNQNFPSFSSKQNLLIISRLLYILSHILIISNFLKELFLQIDFPVQKFGSLNDGNTAEIMVFTFIYFYFLFELIKSIKIFIISYGIPINYREF